MTGDRRARSLLLFLVFAMGPGPALLAKPGKVTSLSECVLLHPQKEKADSECGLGSCRPSMHWEQLLGAGEWSR